MRPLVLVVAVALATAACATGPKASLGERTLPFGCNDTVVIGTVSHGTYQPVASENDVLGHGWIAALLKVRKVVRGAPLPPVLPVRYFAHAEMRRDREFMLVLRRTGSGYEITTGQLMSVRPLLASRCG
ncbi:MAG: hypothetical protein ACJ8FS_00555 [Sphingomicrobium sp.]